MRPRLIRTGLFIVSVAVVGMTSRAIATNPHVDFGSFVAEQLSAHSEQLFGFKHPPGKCAGPYAGADSTQAIQGGPRPARLTRVQQCRIGGRPDRALARR